MDREIDKIVQIIERHYYHSISNEEMANVYLELLQMYNPDIKMLKLDNIQYFFLGIRGKDLLIKKLSQRMRSLELEEKRINKALKELEGM